MATKRQQLEDEIDAYVRGEKKGPRHVAGRAMPRYSKAKGGWTGGDTRTLYAFEYGGRIDVRPGHGTRGIFHTGPGVTVRLATLTEAEQHWQRPLHSGWTVAP